jgi:hypothetical protein
MPRLLRRIFPRRVIPVEERLRKLDLEIVRTKNAIRAKQREMNASTVPRTIIRLQKQLQKIRERLQKKEAEKRALLNTYQEVAHLARQVNSRSAVPLPTRSVVVPNNGPPLVSPFAQKSTHSSVLPKGPLALVNHNNPNLITLVRPLTKREKKEQREKVKNDVLYKLEMGVLLMQKYPSYYEKTRKIYEGVSLWVRNPTNGDFRYIFSGPSSPTPTGEPFYYVVTTRPNRTGIAHNVFRKSLDGYILKNKLFDIYVQLPYSDVLHPLVHSIHRNLIEHIEDMINKTIRQIERMRWRQTLR